MRSFIANQLTKICSSLIYLLHNRKTFRFNRLELQSVEFSFSQFAEDLLIGRLATELGILNGVYLDAGAHHPIFGSNTLLLHKRGWRGINIDLARENIEVFDRLRKNDYNVAACLSDSSMRVRIAHYQISSTDRIVMGDGEDSLGGEKPISFSEETTTTLTEIISQSPFAPGEIRYLNIDCEGHDLEVLRGLDLNCCRPAIISIEASSSSAKREITERLTGHNYDLVHAISPVLIFIQEPIRVERLSCLGGNN